MSIEWVLLRGLAREQGHWGPFKSDLQKAYPDSQVLAIDLPGCGVYYNLSSPHKIDKIAEFVLSHLQGARPKKRILVAISLGGMVAAEMIRQRPEDFDGLVIINSSFKNLSPIHHRLQLEALKHIFRALMAGSNEARELAVLDMVSHREDKNKIATEWAEIAQNHPVRKINFVKQLLAAATYNLPEEKPNMPVLVLTSDADNMVNSDCSKKLAEKWQAEIKVHTTAGHELCLDEPEWVIHQIKNFLN